jgi:hypothetical protein
MIRAFKNGLSDAVSIRIASHGCDCHAGAAPRLSPRQPCAAGLDGAAAWRPGRFASRLHTL